MDPDILIVLDCITARLGSTFLLQDTDWAIRRGEQWVVLGPNGAGKSTLVRVLAGEVPHVRGRVIRNGRIPGRVAFGHVSFEVQERMLAREEAKDAARSFARSWDDLETVEDVLTSPGRGLAAGERIFDRLGIAGLRNRPIRFLSTGELRKVLVARALLAEPEVLILDEPFAGLDTAARTSLRGLVRKAMAGGSQVILVTHREEEIPEEATHVLGVREGRVLFQGPRADVLTAGRIRSLYARPQLRTPSKRRSRGPAADDGGPVIEMANVTLRFGEVTVLEGLSWTVRSGERWAVVGPNGSGKTSLMSLITADHPQAYANDIRLFGVPRGSGESIWEIKSRLGMVSPEFQVRYRLPIPTRDVILSGFFDSVGLFRRATAGQTRTAEEWAERLGIGALGSRPFHTLSHGERRLVLLARAMVKSPELLVLDEPCQGLDPGNRRNILDTVDRIADMGRTTILFVTHHPGELPSCIDRTLTLAGPGPPASPLPS